MKSIRDILKEKGYPEPPEENSDTPEWIEPQQPKQQWMRIGDLFQSGGQIVSTLAAILQYLVAISIWLFVALILGCLLISILRG